MFIRSSFELKVGIFIFIGIVILSVIIFSIGNFYTIKRGYTLNILFTFANGISVGAPVRYAGVEVGEIQDVEVYFDEEKNEPVVKLIVWVSHNTWITGDAKANVNTLGLLGEKYLEITPGTREARRLGNRDTLRGQDPISTEELTRETRDTLTRIDTMIESINQVLGDKETQDSIKNTISNLETITTELKEASVGAKELMEDLKQHPWKLLHKPKESSKKK